MHHSLYNRAPLSEPHIHRPQHHRAVFGHLREGRSERQLWGAGGGSHGPGQADGGGSTPFQVAVGGLDRDHVIAGLINVSGVAQICQGKVDLVL